VSDSTNTAAAIVAGGDARRFGGTDKSRLVVAGRTIIVRQVEILQRVASELLIVAPDAARFTDLPARVIADRTPGLGVIGAIETALHATSRDQIIVIACDLPFLTSNLLARLAAMSRGRDGAWIRSERGVEPLIACYRTAARDRLTHHIAKGWRKPSDLNQILDLAELARPELDEYGDPARLLANLNTPGDYARVQYDPA
jgi:molybdenum cofactor guanylyltransferase